MREVSTRELKDHLSESLREVEDLTSDEGLSGANILDIWDDANPHTLNATGDSFGVYYPANRLQTAAATNGFSTVCGDWALINGTHR
jgi:hypothetical protein